MELLLTAIGVRRYAVSKGKKRARLTLHDRIECLRRKRPDLDQVCNALMAVKHLGNAGSHPSEVDDEAVFDGCDILSYILDECYANPHNSIAALSKAIIMSKGPRR